MTETKTNPIVRLMPSLTDVAFLLPVILLFAGLRGVRTLLGDGDTGWHVRIGEWILAHGQVPRQDMFSYTKPGQPFFAWEWLWDVGAAWLHQRWGLAGVVLASLLVIAFSTVLLYRLVYRRCGNPLVSIVLTGLASAAASIHWLARPHLLTMLMMMVFLTLLERVREGHRALLWTLPVLMILWTNLHGGFPIGIIIVGAYGAGELLRAAVTQDGAERRASLRAAAPYLAATAGCALATLVNPYGYQLHVHLFEYLRDPFQLKYIQEFRSADFHSPPAMFLEVMLILGLGAAIWYGRRRQFAEVLLIAGFGHLSLVMVRNMPIYTLAAAPIIAVPLVAWLKAVAEAPIAGWIKAFFGTIVEIGEELVPLERPWRMHLAPIVVMLLLVAGMESPMAGIQFKAEYDPHDYPEKALEALNPAWLNPAGLSPVASSPRATPVTARPAASAMASPVTARPAASAMASPVAERPAANSMASQVAERPAANSTASLVAERPAANSMASLVAERPAANSMASPVAERPAALRAASIWRVNATAAAEPLFEPGEHIFTHDEWGDYLIYKLSPRGFKVFVDGRSDFYGGKFGQEYIDVLEVKYNWQQTLDRYGVDTILLPCDAALTGALKESRRWRVAYDDGMAIVFRPAVLAGARTQQVFTGISGGIGGGDPEITSVKTGILKDRLIKLEEN